MLNRVLVDFLLLAQPLCGQNVLCMATFLVSGGSTPTPGNSTNGTTTSNTTTSMYSVGSVDLTKQLLEQYDISKCSAAVIQAAASVGALLLVASMTTLFSSML